MPTQIKTVKEYYKLLQCIGAPTFVSKMLYS